MSIQKTAHVRDQSIYVAGSSWIVCTDWSNRNGEQVPCKGHFFSHLLFTISDDLDWAINSLSLSITCTCVLTFLTACLYNLTTFHLVTLTMNIEAACFAKVISTYITTEHSVTTLKTSVWILLPWKPEPFVFVGMMTSWIGSQNTSVSC